MTRVSRRRLLTSSAPVVAMAGLLSSTSRALGFTLEPGSAGGSGICGPRNAFHDSVVADLIRELEGRPPAEVTKALAELICPHCGCRLG